jgi:hypothetical protein
VPSFATFFGLGEPGQVALGELERVDVEEMCLSVARHDCVHLRGAHEERVEVGAEQVLLHELASRS